MCTPEQLPEKDGQYASYMFFRPTLSYAEEEEAGLFRYFGRNAEASLHF